MKTSARLWLSAGIIGVLVLLSFVFSTPHAHDVVAPLTASPVATSTPVVTLHDGYKKGTHTITGSLEAPNACTTATVDAAPLQDSSASSTQGIVVVISMPQDVGVCLQEPAEIHFSTSINAPASLPISATVNGIVASTTAL